MHTRYITHRAIFVCWAVALGIASSAAYAQNYPTRPVNFVVPFGPGTGNDVIARIIALKVNETWTQQMVVDNRPGASGSIALEMVAKAQPNGYSIIIASTSQVIAQFVSKVRYDMVKDFAPVSIAGTLPYVLAVSSVSPVKSVNELVALAKSRPGKMSYSGGMIGGVPHFMGVMLNAAHGLDLIMVPYKSTTDALVDIFSGRVEVWFTTMASPLPQVKSGRVRVLGVAGGKRTPALPDVPSMQEAGVPTLDVSVSFFILTPAATPKSAVSVLNQEIVKAINAKDVRERLTAAGVEPMSSTPEELDDLLKREVAKWGKVIKESGYKME
jgi:tripartite-type tricarboxylate transporter receptor subunit TctC